MYDFHLKLKTYATYLDNFFNYKKLHTMPEF